MAIILNYKCPGTARTQTVSLSLRDHLRSLANVSNSPSKFRMTHIVFF
jgi:hypothetical protein